MFCQHIIVDRDSEIAPTECPGSRFGDRSYSIVGRVERSETRQSQCNSAILSGFVHSTRSMPKAHAALIWTYKKTLSKTY